MYTMTDEAPALATYSFLPIINAFAAPSGIDVELKDISVAARVLAAFPDYLTEEQRVPDTLAELGELAKTPDANIIKLPNVSASVPQLKAAVAELQARGYAIPDYPEVAQNDEEQQIQNRYKTVMGSAVNPVLREGNSDRRAPPAVKAFAKKNPHSMGKWTADSKSRVATMGENDFRSNEQSVTIPAATTVRIEFEAKDGSKTNLKTDLALQEGEVLDSTFMNSQALSAFLHEQIQVAKNEGILFSLHLKATMMKVSDPIMFGYAVRAFFANVFFNHGPTLEKIGVNTNNGFGDLLEKIQTLPDWEKKAIEADIAAAYENGPDLAMVDSNRGITNLHVPSDVIVDASMPAMLRTSGQMWNKDDALQDTLCVIPDSCYAGVYQAVFDHCKEHGAFNPSTMGSCPNVGLMAQKAEEYGSHDKTFQMDAAGVVRIIDADGKVLTEHTVNKGDIWRACQVKDGPIQDWVKLAVNRARATGSPAVFWLNQDRPHDAQLIAKVNTYLADHDTNGLDIRIMAPALACKLTLERMTDGQDTISCTGNVLRDYNTDLFPILELGTSAKMLSIVPLMAGGGLFETGAGGSAPKHVQQFEKEGHLRWDSLGEFLALAVSFEHISERYGLARGKIMGGALERATATFLLENKSPSRKVNEIDNRGSHFYLAMYWAQELAAQTEDAELAEYFSRVAQELADNEDTISNELIECQGPPQNVGGYFMPEPALASEKMRPSPTLNSIIDNLMASATGQ